MRYAVVGAGAIGAFAGALLSKAGEDVSLIARGEHLRTMQEHGVRVFGEIGEFVARPACTDDPARVGTVDVVLLTLKAHSLTAMAPRLAPLLSPETCVVSVQNGIPWWYFQGHGGPWEGTYLEAVDPGGVVGRSIEPRRVVGSVTYFATAISAPGVIEHIEGNRFVIGEPDGSKSERCQRIAESFINAGFRCPVRSDLRRDVWVKLMGNVAFNPISALSRATLLEIARMPETRNLAREIMREVEAVANKLGIETGISTEQRLAGAEKVGHHKTSMLQDVEAGRPLELEPIVGAVVELGDKLGVPLPSTRSVYACAKLMAENLQKSKNRPAE